MSAKEVLFSPIGRGRFYASRKNSPRRERTKTMDKIKLSESNRWCVTAQESVTRQDIFVGDSAHDVPETETGEELMEVAVWN